MMPSSLVRSAKRQKLDSMRGNPYEATGALNTNGYHYNTLLSLVDMLVSVQSSDTEDFIEIIEKIRSHPFLLEHDSLRRNKVAAIHDYHKTVMISKLHGNLILRLGFLLASFKEVSLRVFSSLVFCLRDLYTNDDISMENLNTEEEFGELFILIPKVVRIIDDKIDESNVCEAIKMRDTVLGCYQIMKSWLRAPRLLKKVLAYSSTNTLEDFLLSLIIVIDQRIIKSGSGEEEIQNVLACLGSICNVEAEFRILLDVTKSAVQLRQASPHVNLSPPLVIFFWRCISRVHSQRQTKSERKIQLDFADRAVEAIMPYCASEDHLLSNKATVGITELIGETDYNTRIRLITFIVESVKKKIVVDNDGSYGKVEENEIDGNLVALLECFGLCINTENVCDYFFQIDEWEKVFDALVSISVDQKNIYASEKSAAVVLPILNSLVTKVEQPLAPLFHKAIEICLELTHSESISIVKRTLDLLFDLVENPGVERRIRSASLAPDMINALALLSPKAFLLEESTKSKLAQTFALLVEGVGNIHFLARQTSNLAFLVRLASGSYCETLQSRAQQISVSVLMKLARNPCNRRILANQPGLLSSLIRYTRMTPEGTDLFVESKLSRKEMKDQILLVADAL